MGNARATIFQSLSAVAVVLSLMFVGLEIRRNTAAQRAETRQGLADASREFTLALSTNADMRRVYYAMFRPDLDDGQAATLLTSTDTIQARISVWTHLRNVENVFLQSLEGVIDESVLDTYGFRSKIYEGPFFPLFWRDVRSRFDSRFVEAFEEANDLS